MKALLAASFTALLLAGAAAAYAEPGVPAVPSPTATETLSTPYAHSNHGSEALPIFNYQGAVPLTSITGPSHANSTTPWNTSADLVNQTGGAR
ncbi:MAG: hypothetical protein ACREFO_06945 [Acetobacteraceae bacterium]